MDPSPQTTRPLTTWSFRVSAFLWVVWGLVHILAGVLTLAKIGSGDPAEAVYGITPKADRDALNIEYPDAVVAILSQHGMNLAWFGLITTIAAPLIWRRHRYAVYLAVIVGGFADLAYFAFIDLGGFAAPPGPQMTYICAAAIVTGLVAVRTDRSGGIEAT